MIYFKTKYQSTLVKVTFNQIAGKFRMILPQIIRMQYLYFVVRNRIHIYLLTYVWTFNRSAFAYGLFVEDTFQSPPPSSILHGNNPTSKNSSARGKKAVFLQLQPQNCINFITLKWLNDCAIRGLGYPLPIKTLYYYYYCGSICILLFRVYKNFLQILRNQNEFPMHSQRMNMNIQYDKKIVSQYDHNNCWTPLRDHSGRHKINKEPIISAFGLTHHY